VPVYYKDDLVTLYHGSCIEELAWLEADVLITDPPYGVAYVSNSSKYGSTPPIAADEDTGLRDEVLRMWGSEKPGIAFGSWKAPRPENIRHLLIWDKGDSPGMGDLSLPWGPGHEEIYVWGQGWTGTRRSNVIRVKTLSASDKDRPDHPTPKPAGLMEHLVSYAPLGTIADPFSGSGSTLLAARAYGRKCIGIELEERYCEMIANRLAQGSLFSF
jgi:site-specific DNA-methyltransferase (adenine-specific)